MGVAKKIKGETYYHQFSTAFILPVILCSKLLCLMYFCKFWNDVILIVYLCTNLHISRRIYKSVKRVGKVHPIMYVVPRKMVLYSKAPAPEILDNLDEMIPCCCCYRLIIMKKQEKGHCHNNFHPQIINYLIKRW